MNFTLRLHISGLALFTKQQENGVETMRVLLPETKGHPQHHRHYAKLYFEKQYIPTPHAIRSPLDVDGLLWTVPSGNTPTALPSAHQMLVNLSDIDATEFKIPGPANPANVKISGEVLLSDGKFMCQGETAKFVIEVPGSTISHARVMTNRLVWEIDDLPGNALSLLFKELDSGDAFTVELQPQNGLIELHLLNALQNEHDGNPGQDRCDPTKHNHFAMYRALFPGMHKNWQARCNSDACPPTDCDPPKLPKPIPGIDQGTTKRDKGEPAAGTRIYTCMLASADVE